MNVEVVVPFAGGCDHRRRAWWWVRSRLAPFAVTVAPGPEPWCKASAVTPAVEASDADVIVVHDADVWCPGLQDAIDVVVAGKAWAMPHTMVRRLSQAGTANVLAGGDPASMPLDEQPYPGLEGGGCVVAHRDVLLDVPLDDRFVGWGGEDEAWGFALRCLHGAPWRHPADLHHLWHPPQTRRSRRRGSRESWRLRCDYLAAMADPAAMRALLDETTRQDFARAC